MGGRTVEHETFTFGQRSRRDAGVGVHAGVVEHQVGLLPLDRVEKNGDVGEVFLVGVATTDEQVVGADGPVPVEGAGVDVEVPYPSGESS